MTARALFALALLSACVPPEAEPVQEDVDGYGIRDGSPAPSYADKVLKATDIGGGFSGTAWMGRYPRCAVTAEHVTLSRVEDGTGKYQEVNNQTPRGWHVSPQPATPYSRNAYGDLEVGWMEARTGGDYLDTDGLDWLDIAEVPGTTPTSTSTTQPNSTTTAPLWSLGGELIGWGRNETNAAGVDLREASFVGYQLRNGSSAGFDYGGTLLLGTYYTPKPCGGDSGGPFVVNGSVYGLQSATPPWGCGPVLASWVGVFHHVGILTAFNSYAAASEESNYDWLDRTIESVCGKALSVSVDGEGSVTGDRSGASVRTFTDLPSIDGAVDCSFTDGDDCGEMVHFGESIQLSASAEPDWEFSEWQSGASGAACPCEGDTSETCDVVFDDMGEYDASTSIDDVVCVAVF